MYCFKTDRFKFDWERRLESFFEAFNLRGLVLLSMWLTELRRSLLFPQVSISSFAFRKSRLQHFSLAPPLKHVSNGSFCTCCDFLSVCWYLIFTRPSKKHSVVQINKAFFLHFSTAFYVFLHFFSSVFNFLASFLPSFAFFPLRTPSPKTIITSLVIQLADRLIRQKKLNPTAQHRQIILFAKPAFPPSGTMLSFTPEWP